MMYKVEAEGDEMYIRAASLEEAKYHFEGAMGQIPEELLTWTEINEKDLPQDAIPITFEEIQ